jgi:hypothetical protein
MKHNRKTQSGQAAVILAIAFVGLLAFSALAIDGGNAYLTRRNAQNAADAASMAGTRELYQILRVMETPPTAPDEYLRLVIVDAAQRNGVPDTNGIPSDEANTNVEAWYVDEDGELSVTPVGDSGQPPIGYVGVAVTAHIPFDTFIAHIVDRDTMKATTRAASVFTERGGAVNSTIYANATECDPNTLKLTGSQQLIGGGIHSNGNIHIQGNTDHPSVYTGTMEYATTLEIQPPAGAIIVNPPDNQATQTPPNVLPLLFDIEDYAPEGVRAEAAGEHYYYFSTEQYGDKVNSQELRAAGLLDGDGNLASGLYYAQSSFDLTGELHGSAVTFVTPGSFVLQSSYSYFGPYEPQLVLFALEGNPGNCDANAIGVNSSEAEWTGLVYAPYGQVTMSMAKNGSLWGSIVGYTVDLSGSEMKIIYEPRYDPPIPPKVVLIW